MSDMNALFSKDPFEYTDADIDAIVEDMRKKRHLFNQAPATTKTKSAPKQTAKQKQAAGLNLDIKL